MSSSRLLSVVLTLLVVAIQVYVILVNQFCNISIKIALSSAFEIHLFKLAQKRADADKDDNDDLKSITTSHPAKKESVNAISRSTVGVNLPTVMANGRKLN